MFEPGHQLGHYRIVRSIGSGGMADVYEAEDQRLGRRVALKILPSNLGRNAELVARFEKEVRASALLNHRSIVTVFEVGCENGCHYYSMRMLTGGDLRSHMERGLSEAEALAILRELADAFQHAHSHGFVHRDMKPENVIFDEQGFPVLTDFGIAKALDQSGQQLTLVGTSMGTPRYVSPEQARGKGVDARTDLYSLGVVFYEMLTGKPPYEADDPLATLFKHVTDPIPRLPEPFAHLQGLVDKMLAKNPDERVPSGQALVEMIDALPRKQTKQEFLQTIETSAFPNLLKAAPLPRAKTLLPTADDEAVAAAQAREREAAEAERKRKEQEAAAERERQMKADAQRRAEEDARREKQRQEDAARAAADAEQRKKAEAEAQQRRQAEEAQREKQRQEEAARNAVEAERRRKEQEAQAERDRERLAEERRQAEARRAEEAKRKAEEDRIKAEEAERQRQIREAEKQRELERRAEAQRLAEIQRQEEAARKAAEAERKRQEKEAAEQRKREEKEAARLQREAERQLERERKAAEKAEKQWRKSLAAKQGTEADLPWGPQEDIEVSSAGAAAAAGAGARAQQLRELLADGWSQGTDALSRAGERLPDWARKPPVWGGAAAALVVIVLLLVFLRGGPEQVPAVAETLGDGEPETAPVVTTTEATPAPRETPPAQDSVATRELESQPEDTAAPTLAPDETSPVLTIAPITATPATPAPTATPRPRTERPPTVVTAPTTPAPRESVGGASSSDSQAIQSLLSQGRTALQRREYDNAISYAESILFFEPDNAGAQKLLADAQQAKQRAGR